MSKKKRRLSVLKVLSEASAKRAALSPDEVKEALQIGGEERQQAEIRVPHVAVRGRRFR